MEIKPIKIDLADGKLKQFTSTDEVPLPNDIKELRHLLATLVLELMNMGFNFQDKRLIKLITEI